jgi:protein TonB|tara:strand:+ start:81322 stop:81708 length:387 start_codon:yes stop_codon:yes gene_type:complete
MKKIGLMLLFVAIGFSSFAQNEVKPDSELKSPPTFIGGQESMMKFVAENIKYPKEALESETSGTVYTQLLINEKGKIIEVEILRGVSKTLDMEAIRVIEAMPNWKPAMDLDGNPVKSIATLPIAFRMN